MCKMKITIKYTNLDSTPAMNEWVEKKLRPLEKFLSYWEKENETIARVELARTTRHHNKGEVFSATVNLELLPNRILRAEQEAVDTRTAIDLVKDKIEQEIRKLSAEHRPQDSRGQEELRKL